MSLRKRLEAFSDELVRDFPSDPAAWQASDLNRQFAGTLPIGPGVVEPVGPKWNNGVSEPDKHGAVLLQDLYEDDSLPDSVRLVRYLLPYTPEEFAAMTPLQQDTRGYNQGGILMGFTFPGKIPRNAVAVERIDAPGVNQHGRPGRVIYPHGGPLLADDTGRWCATSTEKKVSELVKYVRANM